MPGRAILEAARHAGISLLITSMDTFGAFERIRAAAGPLTEEDHYKIERFSELLESQILKEDSLSTIFDLYL